MQCARLPEKIQRTLSVCLISGSNKEFLSIKLAAFVRTTGTVVRSTADEGKREHIVGGNWSTAVCPLLVLSSLSHPLYLPDSHRKTTEINKFKKKRNPSTKPTFAEQMLMKVGNTF
jgi:hypothetical protein